MTWNQLVAHIQALPMERRDDTATVFDQLTDNFIPVLAWEIAGAENDVLDDGHAIIVIGPEALPVETTATRSSPVT